MAKALILEGLAKELNLSISAFEREIGVANTTISKAIKRNADISIQVIEKIVRRYPTVNKKYLIEGEEPKFISGESKPKNLHSTAVPIGEINDEAAEQYGKNKYIDLGAGRYIMMVPIVDQYSYGGYLVGYKDPEYIEELNTQPVIVDKRHRGVYMCFEQRGDSMNGGPDPIKEGDKVVGRLIEPIYWKSKLHIHKFNEFIIVHKGGILVKQITNHDVEAGIITIHSYNEDKVLYPDTTLDLAEVVQLFNVVEVSKKR